MDGDVREMMIKYRASKRLKQADFAELLGVSQMAISKIENGGNPSAETADRFEELIREEAYEAEEDRELVFVPKDARVVGKKEPEPVLELDRTTPVMVNLRGYTLFSLMKLWEDAHYDLLPDYVLEAALASDLKRTDDEVMFAARADYIRKDVLESFGAGTGADRDWSEEGEKVPL